jgi:hypothetical protein
MPRINIPNDTNGIRFVDLPTSSAATNLIVKEIDFNKASTEASTKRYQCKYDYTKFSSKKSNGDDTNNWKPVKNSDSDIIRQKKKAPGN